jgi:hypothetical protein
MTFFRIPFGQFEWRVDDRHDPRPPHIVREVDLARRDAALPLGRRRR